MFVWFSSVIVGSCVGSKNRALPCPICKVICFQLPRHLERAHIDDERVKTALEHGSMSPQMRKLINTGIFKYNVEVLQAGEGNLIVARGSSLRKKVEDYVPCKYCLLMFVKEEVYRHSNRCILKETPSTNDRCVVSDGLALLDGAVSNGLVRIPELLRKQVLSRMRNDKLTHTVMNDSLILSLGTCLLHKLGPKRSSDIAQRMRQLARLSERLKSMKQLKSVQVADYISGAGFDDIVQAIEIESDAYVDSSGRRLFKNPCIALKLGHSLMKLAHLKKGQALRQTDEDMMKQAESYISLHTSEYTDRVSSPALASQKLTERKLQEFPDEKDMGKLKEYMLTTMKCLTEKLKCHSSSSDWRELAEICLTRLIIFNARRGSEGSELTVEEYKQKTNSVHESIVESMTDEERKLLSR